MRAQYAVGNSAAVALAAATAKTCLAVLAPASFGVDLLKFSIGFDGVTASAVPVLWELCALTAATNSTPGTGNTNENSSIVQLSGRSITTGFTAFGASTSEPTVLTAIRKNLLTPAGGLLVYDFPFGDSPDSPVSQGFALRLTAPAAVNVRCDFQFARA